MIELRIYIDGFGFQKKVFYASDRKHYLESHIVCEVFVLLLAASDSKEIARLVLARKSYALEVVMLVVVEAKDLACALKEDENYPEP